MHAIIAVIHEKDVNVESFFERYLYDNEEYFEKNLIGSKEEILEILSEQRKNSNGTEWADHYDNMTDKERIKDYCNDYYFQLDYDGNIYENSNPYGECDWYEIGGRWSGMLIDYSGNSHDSLRLLDFNYDNMESIKTVYGYVLNYDDDVCYDLQIDESKDSFKNKLKEARNYGEQNNIDLYITLVDIHQ